MTDDIETIREAKRERLQRTLREQAAGTAETEGRETPREPVHVEGAEELSALVADGGVVLVDFYADWCGPCKMLEPTVEALAAETPATVAKVDVDVDQALAAEYGVRGVPTLLLFAGGQPVERVVGVRDRDTLERLIDQYAA
jgi:thioredoxin 1